MLLNCMQGRPYPTRIAAEEVRPAWKLAAKSGPPALDILSAKPIDILPLLLFGLAEGLLQPVDRYFMAGHDPPGFTIEAGKERARGSPRIVCLTSEGRVEGIRIVEPNDLVEVGGC